jgi:CRISPR-associated protein Csm4
LLKANDEAILKQVKAAFRLLADSGIGTDRNTGNGQFEVTFSEIELNLPKTGNYDLSLSLYCPTELEIANCIHKSFYGLTKRGGYISNPEQEIHLTIRKRSIYMFTEGSMFPTKSENRIGKIEDLKPSFAGLNHPIWRDGRAFFVPLNYKEDF